MAIEFLEAESDAEVRRKSRTSTKPTSTIDDRVRTIMEGRNYHKIVSLEDENGQQKRCYRSSWGAHDSGRFLKALVHDRSGIPRDIDALSRMNVDESLANHVSPIVDYVVDGDLSITVEPDFSGARTLRQIIDQDGPITKKRDFEMIFSQVISAMDYLANKQGIMHRDLHGDNILVRKGEKGIEVRLTDLGKSAVIKDNSEIETTECSRFIRDPFIDKIYTGKDDEYGQKSEAYAIGMNALVSLIGQSPVEYDYKKGSAINAFTGESLIDNNGKWSRDKHNEAISQGIKKIPKKIRKSHGFWIESCLTATPVNRPTNLASVDSNFRYAANPSSWEKFKKNWSEFLIVGAITGMAGVVGGLGIFVGDSTRSHELNKVQLAEAHKYQVSADWDGGNLEIKNNLFEMEIDIRNNDGTISQDFVRRQPGEFLGVSVKGFEFPRKKDTYSSNTSLEGQLYLEGFEIEGNKVVPFDLHLRDSNRATDYGRGAYYFAPFKHFQLPQDLPPGVYILSAEIYAPTQEKLKTDKIGEEMTFDRPGKALARKRIPIVIGNPENLVDLGEIKKRFPEEQFSFRNLIRDVKTYGNDDTPSPKGKYFVASPTDNFFLVEDIGSMIQSQSPDTANESENRIYFFSSYDSSGNRQGYTGVPFVRKCLNCNSVKIAYKGIPEPIRYTWELDFPDRQFAEELFNYRSQIDNDYNKTLQGKNK